MPDIRATIRELRLEGFVNLRDRKPLRERHRANPVGSQNLADGLPKRPAFGLVRVVTVRSRVLRCPVTLRDQLVDGEFASFQSRA
jgi:hypothetical protein